MPLGHGQIHCASAAAAAQIGVFVELTPDIRWWIGRITHFTGRLVTEITGILDRRIVVKVCPFPKESFCPLHRVRVVKCPAGILTCSMSAVKVVWILS